MYYVCLISMFAISSGYLHNKTVIIHSPTFSPVTWNSHKSSVMYNPILLNRILTSIDLMQMWYFPTHLRRRLYGASCWPCTYETPSLMAFQITLIFRTDSSTTRKLPVYVSTHKCICTHKRGRSYDLKAASGMNASYLKSIENKGSWVLYV